MRIWDIPPDELCRRHLLGEHRELHAVWIIITTGKKGYSRHPETKRWIGKLAALYRRHEELVREMKIRKYKHYSGLDKRSATGKPEQDTLLSSLDEQRKILREKKCMCYG